MAEKEKTSSNKNILKFFQSFSDEKDGQSDVSIGKEIEKNKVEVIKTGSYLLDEALSCGGLPKGRIIQFYGASACGKTAMAMLAIANAQREDPDAMQVFIDAEGTFDPSWAMHFGIDVDRIILVEDDTAVYGRKCFEFLLGVPKEDAKTKAYNGKSKEGLLDKIRTKDFNINIIVLDSLGALIPPGEDTSSVGKHNISLLARFLSTTCKKLSLEVKKAKIPFIIINHRRDNMDPYGSDHAFGGGNAYKHSLSANIYFNASSTKANTIYDSSGEKIGGIVRATIEKSKFGPHPKKCDFKLHFYKGIIDIHEEIIKLAINYNVIERVTSATYAYKDKKWVGFGKMAQDIQNDNNLQEELLSLIAINKQNKIEPLFDNLLTEDFSEEEETDAGAVGDED